MALSNDLISQFVKVTKDKQDVKKETVVYGTVDKNDTDKVIIDGSTISTPVTKTVVAGTHDETENGASVIKGDRVIVTIKNHTATVTGNLSRPSARAADTVSMTNLDASNAKIDNLESAKADVQDLIAVEADVEDLKANKASVDSLLAVKADITNLKAADVTITNKLNALSIDTKDLEAASAFIDQLEATGADIGYLVSTVADIDTLMFSSASGRTVHSSFSNSVIAQLGDAQIKSAMIENISASKITSGDIITNNVRVKSQNGSLIISDETLQISDGTRVRVQVGKDAANDYSINIWDQNGNLMFSKGGITDAAIKEAIIRNDMVSDTANIHASKLDVDSLFEEINGSTNTIKSTQIYVDEKKQTLDVAFKSLTTEMTTQGQTISSQGTQISAIQGQISSKIWQQDIDAVKNNMTTQYSTLEQSLNSLKTTVGTNYATKTELSYIDVEITNLDARILSNESSITQLNNKITANVAETTNLGTRMTTVEQTATGLTTRITTAEHDIVDAAKTATNFMDLSTNGLVVGDMTTSSLGKNILIGSNSIKIRTGSADNAIFGADTIELAKNNETATISMLNGTFKIYYGSDTSEAGLGIYGKTSTGEERLAFQPVNENNNLTIGWGGYNAKANSTNIYGHNLKLIAGNDMSIECEDWKVNIDGNLFARASNNEFLELIGLSSDNNTAIGHGGYSSKLGKTNIYGNKIQHIVNTTSGSASYKPYYEAGDSFETEWYGSGFISSSSKVVYFSIPLAKPIIGNTVPTVKVTNGTNSGGLQIRQNSAYVFGSTSSAKASPASYSAKVVGDGNFVQIEATMANTTNAVNNEVCGINASIKITFS